MAKSFLKLLVRRDYAPLFSDKARFIFAAIFVAATFLMGGGSRHDITSLIVLRPLAFLAIAYCITVVRADLLKDVRVPLFLLLSLALLILLHLIPLPPTLWSALPGRALFLTIYETAEMALPWLPLAMSPSRALNSLMALSLPLAMTLLYAIQSKPNRTKLWLVIWAAILASVSLGMLQLVSSGRGALYLYRITNENLPVGLFANRNHHALMVGIGIVIAAALLSTKDMHGRAAVLIRTLAGASIFLFFPFLLTIGSRAGLLIGVLLLIPAGFVLYHRYILHHGSNKARFSRKVASGILIGGVLAIASLFVSAIALSRSLAFDRLVRSAGGDEVRSNVLPLLWDLYEAHFIFGTGFGSFEYAYRRIEPLDMLIPAYLNQAHNDWMQFVIEGGLPALALLLVFVAWVAKAAFSILRRGVRGIDRLALTSLAVIFACALASIVDYPMRVPSVMIIFAMACATLADRTKLAPTAEGARQ